MRRCAAAIDQQRLGGTANARAAHFGIQDDASRHRQIGAAHPHTRGTRPRDARSPARAPRCCTRAIRLLPPRGTMTSMLSRHLARACSRPRRDRWWAPAGCSRPADPPRLAAPRCRQRMNGGVRARALRAAPQDHRVARLQAQRARIRGHVGPALVNDADHAERHATRWMRMPFGRVHSASTVPMGSASAAMSSSAARHGLDARLVETQAVEQRRASSPPRAPRACRDRWPPGSCAARAHAAPPPRRAERDSSARSAASAEHAARRRARRGRCHRIRSRDAITECSQQRPDRRDARSHRGRGIPALSRSRRTCGR